MPADEKIAVDIPANVVAGLGPDATGACAQDPEEHSSARQPCTPIGKTAKGELVYSLKCESLPASVAPQAEVKPPLPAEPESRSGLFGWSYDRRKPED